MAEMKVLAGDKAAEKVEGFRFGTAACGIKSKGTDVLVIAADGGAVPAAGVFTQNKTVAAPVVLSRETAKRGRALGMVVNSGNANCMTGEAGMKAAADTVEKASALLGQPGGPVLVASTGIIGRLLDMDKLSKGLKEAAGNLGKAALQDAARAIMTTDTFPKAASATMVTEDGEFTIAGIAKGAGMIAPNMGTMIACVLTDAKADAAFLDQALRAAVEGTFNAVTIDGDTSTNDTLVLLASGKSGVEAGKHREAFEEALFAVSLELSKMIARDGEGATKLVEVHVSGAGNDDEARKMARTIAESPLVKTAIHGEDPNWGRIIAAAGRSGTEFDPYKAALTIGGVVVFEKGTPTGREKAAHEAMTAGEILIVLSCGLGGGAAAMYTCDLSRDYVTINADYHT